MPYCKYCGAGTVSAGSYCSSCGAGPLKTAGVPDGAVKFRRVIVWSSLSLLVIGVLTAILLILFSSPYIAVPGKYRTIQEAVDSARDGKIIVVEPGIYRENIDFRGKSVTLQSSDPDDPEIVAATVLDGGGNGPVVTFQGGEGEEPVLSGFTITGGGGTRLELEHLEGDEQATLEGFFGGGILVLNGSSPTIKNNVISGNECPGEGGGGGIAVWNASATIEGNTIRENRAAKGGGIFVGGVPAHSTILKNNLISGNSAVNGGGVYIGMMSSVVMEGNTISENRAEHSVNSE